jgi:SGNH hydrolase-like domain, acetyltransferase AlgX
MTTNESQRGQPFATEAGAADAHLPSGPPPGLWRLLDRLVVVAFALVLIVPGVLLGIGVHAAQVENRAPRPFPKLSVAALLDASWPAGIDGFLTDHLAVRPYAIRVRGEAYWLAGGTGNPEVLRGRDGWLFIRDEFQPPCDYTGAQQRAALVAADRAFTASGIDFRLLLIPAKHSVYPDKVAPEPRFAPSCQDTGRADIEQAVAELRGHVVDLRAAMAAARTEPGAPDLYWFMDTHWSPSGAVLGVRELIRSFDATLWSDADVIERGKQRRVMDSAKLLGLHRVAVTPKLVVRPGVEQERSDVDVPVDVQNARAVFRITCSGDRPLLPGRTLVIYDSFFGIDTRLVAPFFADTTWVHVGDMIQHPELASMLGPFDRVIVERVERGFYATNIGAIVVALTAHAPG